MNLMGSNRTDVKRKWLNAAVLYISTLFDILSRIYYHSIGTLVPNGTSIRCSMTGNTTSDAYGNTVWASLSSHSSRLNSGYGTDWTETDFSYDLIDGRRTYVCHFIGTLEEPYKQSGFIEYYVYSEGWDIWFEAYST